MGRKKLIIFVLLTMFLAYGGVATTYAYFTDGKTVANKINIELGNIKGNFVNSEGTVITNEIINIQGMLPGQTRETTIRIKNTETLTNKIAIGFSGFPADASLLQYLRCKVVIENNSFEYKLSEIAGETLELKDSYGNPRLLKQNDVVNGTITLTLDEDTPYTEQYKTLNFNVNIYASQPNDADWHTN